MTIKRSTAQRMQQWYTAATKRLSAKGYRVSAGSYCFTEDNPAACVFSIENWGPSTYGHPRYTLLLTVEKVRPDPREDAPWNQGAAHD